MSFSLYEYSELGFYYDPKDCDLSILRYFVYSNRTKFKDAKFGQRFDELERIYKNRERNEY